jgi:photosystem II biogenesis protein Psp29
VADTKRTFYTLYRKPLPAIYNVVLQELLVQAHLVRNNVDYAYDAVYALGLTSTLEAVLEGLEGSAGDKEAVFDAFVKSLGEDPARYRSDAAEMAKFAKEAAGSALAPAADGSFGQQALAAVAARAAAGELYYSRFLAVGVFRLLELSGAKDPKALEQLASAMGVPQAAVARDLGTYKAVLSKLAAAKELMRELLERERKKQAERAAEKAAKASGAVASASASSGGEGESVGATARAGEVMP